MPILSNVLYAPRFAGGTLTMTSCMLSGNSAGAGGGIFNLPSGTLTLGNCTQCSIGAYEADGFSPEPCVGDCDGTGSATIDEIITLVNIALGTAQPSACPDGVPSGAQVDIALIIQAVNAALNGCGSAAAATM